MMVEPINAFAKQVAGFALRSGRQKGRSFEFST